MSEELEVLWPEGKAISAPKLKDIQSTFHLIREAEQEFYNTFISN